MATRLLRKERSMSGADRHVNSQSGIVYCNPQLLPLRAQRGDQLLNFLTEAGAVQPFLAEAPPGFGERHETELMHPENRRGWSSFPACLRRVEHVNVPGGRFHWQVQGARKAPTAFTARVPILAGARLGRQNCDGLGHLIVFVSSENRQPDSIDAEARARNFGQYLIATHGHAVAAHRSSGREQQEHARLVRILVEALPRRFEIRVQDLIGRFLRGAGLRHPLPYRRCRNRRGVPNRRQRAARVRPSDQKGQCRNHRGGEPQQRLHVARGSARRASWRGFGFYIFAQRAERICSTTAAGSADSWNKRIAATPAAPESRHVAAFSSVIPPIASTGMRTLRQTSPSFSSPRAGP